MTFFELFLSYICLATRTGIIYLDVSVYELPILVGVVEIGEVLDFSPARTRM
jgi:hypothetical protein